MNSKPTIIVTGSSGLVGSGLVDYFMRRGFHVRAFQRKLPEKRDSAPEYYSFDLADIRDNGFTGAQYLIHCAYRPVVGKKDRMTGRNIDIEGTKKIITLARKHNIKVIFLSTLSAHPEAKSYYAKNKLICESLFDLNKDLIVKLGIVLGAGGGLIGRLAVNLKKHKFVPLIGGGKQLTQIIALDDLCRIIEAGIVKDIAGCFRISHPTAISTGELYRAIAHRVGAHPVFISVPLRLMYHCVKLAEEAGITLPFTSENILGLCDLRAYDTKADLEVFGQSVKDCHTSLDQLSFSFTQ